MKKHVRASTLWALPFVLLVGLVALSSAQTSLVRTGGDAFTDWKADAPGLRRHIRPGDVPAPITDRDPEGSVASNANVVPPQGGAVPKVPEGFTVEVFATGFKQPRIMRVAPNGDIFLAESGAGRVVVFRESSATPEVFAENLNQPYGIAFQPPADPQYVYVAAANQVVRYPYRSGNAKATGRAEVIVDNIPTERHWTRDLAVSRDGMRLFLAVGSASNLGVGGMPDMPLEKISSAREDPRSGRGVG